jgi:WD40 repeat protein
MTLRLWDLADGHCLRVLHGHTDKVNSIAIGPDGRWGLSGGCDKTIRLWDLTSGQCHRILEGHTDRINSIAISPEGRWGLSNSADRTLRLWDVGAGLCVRAIEIETASVTSVACSPDWRWIVTGSIDGTLAVFDLNTGERVRSFRDQEAAVDSVAISPNSRWVLTGSSGDMATSFTTNNNTLCLWELDWGYAFPGWSDWDEGARAYLEIFLTLRYAQEEDGLTRVAKPAWPEEDFQKLLAALQSRGYGWLRAEGVRRRLEEMTAQWKGPPPLPWEQAK